MTALIFDCDGVLADTERYGHLPAFNAMFAEFDLPVQWSEDEYGQLLAIGGGKERMASLFRDPSFLAKAGIPADPDEQTQLLASWHKSKTKHFTELVTGGHLPARPGVRRILASAVAAGWAVAVASTSAEESVRAVLESAVGAEVAAQVMVFAGDVVPAKKPEPAIYLLAVERMGISPRETLVIEDSRNGLLAATRAGLQCLITVNGYTRHEVFDEALMVVSELGDPDRPPIQVLQNRSGTSPGDFLTLQDLQDCIAGFSQTPA